MLTARQRYQHTTNSGKMRYKERLSSLQTRWMLLTHTRVANQNTPSTFLPFKYISLSFLLSATSLLLLLPLPPQPQPFFDHHHHPREGSMQKGIAAGAIACYVCLSPSVIVVDFDRCPQKHCSICAPFWRNGLRILIDLGWWGGSLTQSKQSGQSLSQHSGDRQHSVAGQPLHRLAAALTALEGHSLRDKLR